MNAREWMKEYGVAMVLTFVFAVVVAALDSRILREAA